jgi:hypothetical protein
MKSMAESARSLSTDAAADPSFDGEQREAIRRWADEIVERTAGLCIGLDAARSSRDYSQDVFSTSPGNDAGNDAGQEVGRDAQEAAHVLRDVDALYTRTLELIGRTALDIRELSVRFARARGSRSALELRELGSLVSRFGDEGEAWREIRELEERSS